MKKERRTKTTTAEIAAILTMFTIFIAVLMYLLMMNETLTESKSVYESCVGSCSKKYSQWAQNGVDCVTANNEGNNARLCFPRNQEIEYDRTGCIRSCNQMYLTAKGKIK